LPDGQKWTFVIGNASRLKNKSKHFKAAKQFAPDRPFSNGQYRESAQSSWARLTANDSILQRLAELKGRMADQQITTFNSIFMS
jgi:hypothetical protein